MKTISKVKSGELSICEHCNNYHLIFNNIFLELNKKEFKALRKFISEIDCDYWESKYPCDMLSRKIPIPSKQDSLILMFNRSEINELKVLLSQKKSNYVNLNIDDIDYDVILN